MAGIMPEAVRYPAELQVADEGTFDGFHDPFRIPDPVLGKYLDEVLVEGGKNAVSEEVETLFQPFVELAEQKAGEDGIAAAVGDDVPDEVPCGALNALCTPVNTMTRVCRYRVSLSGK